MATKHDILDLEDIQLLVHSFYSKVLENELLNPVFKQKIPEDQWPVHLEKMVRFWQTLLLEEHTYSGNPLAHHLHLPVSGDHFTEWLRLFHATVDIHFQGQKAEEAHKRAEMIATVFQAKIKQFNTTEQ